jgi:glutamate carboxypeptidase
MKRKSLQKESVGTVAPGMPLRVRYFRERREQMIATIRQIVEMESPSDHKPSVDRLGEFLAARFEERGGKTKLHRTREFGDHLQVDFAGQSKVKPVLLLGHHDTVWSLGTLEKMPCKVNDVLMSGPGVLDMKTGIALMLHTIEALRDWYGDLPRPVTVLLVSDEEVGSDSSRHITEALATKSAGVLVLEPAAGLKGALKTARKGVGEYSLKIHGKAAHSGLDFEKGESAILELARQLTEIAKFTDLGRGLTVNPGVIRGGTRTNVIAAEASADIDARIARLEDAGFIEKKMRSLKPFNSKCKLEIAGGINRPPMERIAGVAALFEKAVSLGRAMDWKVQEASVGGGSDGNFTTALGIPTLDGLGAVGEGAHALNESIFLAELPRRAALISGLIESA